MAYQHQYQYQHQHRPSPYSIAVSALIVLHCEEQSPLYQQQQQHSTDREIEDHDPDMTFHAVDRFLQKLLLQMTSSSSFSTSYSSNSNSRHQSQPEAESTNDSALRGWSSRHDLPVHELLQRLAEATNNPRLAQELRGWLTVAVMESVDGLVDFMATLQLAVEDGRVDASSCHGVYLRRNVLGFEALSFERVLELWRALKLELVLSEQDEKTVFSSSLSSSWTRSAPQMEEAIRRVVLQFGREGSQRRPTPADLEEMQTQVATVIQDHPDLPSAHFLRFLLCLETGERAGALQSLHAYLDYAMILHQQQAADNNKATTIADLNVLPLAPILNAVLHERFGERALLAGAIEEAVCVAQQQIPTDASTPPSSSSASTQAPLNNNNSSSECTAHALGWLATLSHGSISVGLLQRCVERCRPHASLRSLQAGALLQLAAQTHDWRPLQEALSAASNDPHQHGSSPCDRPTSLPLALPTPARQYAVAAGLWKAHGVPTLAAHALREALQTRSLSSSDAAWAIRLLVRSGGNVDGSNTDFLAKENYCVYSEALRSLIELRAEHQLSLDDGSFAWESALILHEWAVRRGELDEAESMLVELSSYVHPRLEDAHHEVELAAQTALLRSRQGRWREAQDLLREQIACFGRARATECYPHQAQLLLYLAMVHLECARQCSHDDNASASTAALAPLLECLTLSEQRGWTGVHAAALSVLGQVHLHLFQDRRRAQAVIRAALPQLAQDGSSNGLWHQGEAYLTLAQCHGTAGNKANHRKNVRVALGELQRAEVYFGACHDVLRLREVYYWQARLYHILPDASEARDKAAAKFMRLQSFSGSNSSRSVLVNSSCISNSSCGSPFLYRDQLLELATRPGPAALVAS